MNPHVRCQVVAVDQFAFDTLLRGLTQEFRMEAEEYERARAEAMKYVPRTRARPYARPRGQRACACTVAAQSRFHGAQEGDQPSASAFLQAGRVPRGRRCLCVPAASCQLPRSLGADGLRARAHSSRAHLRPGGAFHSARLRVCDLRRPLSLCHSFAQKLVKHVRSTLSKTDLYCLKASGGAAPCPCWH
jgi:hypothetical protein